MPLLERLDFRTVMTPILLLHAFRHLGLMFLAPGAVHAGIPTRFAVQAAYGDFLAASEKYNSAREAEGGSPTDC